MNTIRQTIGVALRNDSELDNLAPGGVHLLQVPDETLEGPFVIFHLDHGAEEWAMGDGGLEHEEWIVKGAGEDPGAVEDIDARCRVLLDNTSLGNFLFNRRVEPIAYSEAERGTSVYYRGSRYRVSVDG